MQSEFLGPMCSLDLSPQTILPQGPSTLGNHQRSTEGFKSDSIIVLMTSTWFPSTYCNSQIMVLILIKVIRHALHFSLLNMLIFTWPD